jgi:hypothetical protein
MIDKGFRKGLIQGSLTMGIVDRETHTAAAAALSAEQTQHILCGFFDDLCVAFIHVTMTT